MGSQYWWFYDVIVAAIALVCIFIGSKKGVMKSAFGFVGVIIAAILSYAISGAIGDTVSSGIVCESNAKKITENIDGSTFTSLYSAYLEDMGYSIRIDNEKLGKALDSQESIEEDLIFYLNSVNGHSIDKKEVLLEKVHEGYAVVISDMVSRSLNEYAALTAGEIVRENPEIMTELIPLLRDDENIHPASLYIAKNLAAPAYNTIGKLVSFLIIFGVCALGFVWGINAFFSHKEVDAISVTSHFAGGIFGLLTAVAIVFAVAVWVRISAVTGNNQMLFFNNEVVEKSYVFKYFYEFAMKM